MTTTTHPTTGLPTADRAGRPIVIREGMPRHLHAIALRNAGWTWPNIAAATGYATAGSAEAAVTRYVAWRNGNVAATTSRRNRRPAWTLNRSFGVELEFRGITQQEAARALSAVLPYTPRVSNYHDEANTAARGGAAYGEWKIEHDGSVVYYSRSRRVYLGGEVISPVLSGEAGIAELRLVMDTLRRAGATVGVKCGMHVHVDARDLTGEQIANLITAYADRQDAFDQFVAPSRRHGQNHYCSRVGQAEKDRITQSFKATRTAPTGQDRYRTVNVTAFARIGTIEFRQHHGTMNPGKAIAWIETLLALANAAAAAEAESLPTTPAEMIGALGAYGLTARSAAQMTGRLA